MRAAVITRPGGPEVISVATVPVPRPGAGEVRVRVNRSALNRADLLQRAGHYPAPAGASPDIGGIEFAGEVEYCGPGTTRWSVGDRVFGICGGGAHAEYVSVPASTLVAIPDALDWDEAGAVPEAFMTAHDALVTQAGMRAGEWVLIHAVASGVGLAAVQIARASGASTIGTTRSPRKLEVATGVGLTHGLVLEDPATLSDLVTSLIRPAGVNVVLDLVGGAYLAASIEAAALRARIMLVGAIAGSRVTVDIRRILAKRLRLFGTVLRSRPTEEKAAVAAAFEREVVPRLAAGTIRPNIDRIFDLSDIGAAHAYLESNSSAGKVVIRTTHG